MLFKGEKMSKKSVCWVLVLLISSMYFTMSIDVYSAVNFERISLRKQIINSPLYTDPIIITSDDNFTDYGFPGNGTEETPYVIESFDIVTNSNTGIHIYNTTKHFIIQNGIVEANITCIRIDKVRTNTATIKNCYCTGASIGHIAYGIAVLNSAKCEILSNVCVGNNVGIFIYYSDYALVEKNECYNNNYGGIELYYGQFSNISENYLSMNDWAGLELESYFNSSIERNYIGNNLYGIYGDYYFESSKVIYNQIVENKRYGINLRKCKYNLIHHNTFISNNLDGLGRSQAYDNQEKLTNMWYDEQAQAGNYWDDFKNKELTYKYKIDSGFTGERAFDKYPLNENLEPIEHIYTNLVLGIVSFTYLILLVIFTSYKVKKRRHSNKNLKI